jgi:hypothetical protein
MRIVVTEFPKSGGTWITSLIGDALDLPKRDIYVGDGYQWLDLSVHPWYQDAERLALPESCAIKSHELPGSPLAKFDAVFVHLVRDGRDVVVSRYFYERDFCVHNGLTQSFDVPFSEYVGRTAAEWRDYVTAWCATPTPTLRYEDFLADAPASLAGAVAQIGLTVDEERIRHAVQRNTRENLSRSFDRTFRHNTFVRRGMAGDWRNHFSVTDLDAFLETAGDVLASLGYDVALKPEAMI